MGIRQTLWIEFLRKFLSYKLSNIKKFRKLLIYRSANINFSPADFVLLAFVFVQWVF